jgi:hypothetical protein
MNNLKPIMFVVPVIALTLVSILYVYLLKQSTHKKTFKLFAFRVAILAFLLNFAWELIQIPLYQGSSYSVNFIGFCAVASIADVIMVLLLYLGFALILKNMFWVEFLNTQQIIFVILTGGTGAILSEMRHLSLGNWVYADAMPIIPYINVGIPPVLQFMVLPLLTYFLSFHGFKKYLP